MSSQNYFYGTGRRKAAIARVRLLPGKGTVTVNDKTLEEAFPSLALRGRILTPLQVTETLGNFDVVIKVDGGGVAGRADAIRHGIARALLKANESLKPALRSHGLLTRDPRVKERKKYGLRRARKAPQYTKR